MREVIVIAILAFIGIKLATLPTEKKYTAAECINAYQEAGRQGSQ